MTWSIGASLSLAASVECMGGNGNTCYVHLVTSDSNLKGQKSLTNMLLAVCMSCQGCYSRIED